jgi:hypothetical protein
MGREKHAGGVEDGLVRDVTVDGPRGSRSWLDSYPWPSPRLVPRGGRHQPPPRRHTSSARERRRGGTVARDRWRRSSLSRSCGRATAPGSGASSADAGPCRPARTATPLHQVRGHLAPDPTPNPNPGKEREERRNGWGLRNGRMSSWAGRLCGLKEVVPS